MELLAVCEIAAPTNPPEPYLDSGLNGDVRTSPLIVLTILALAVLPGFVMRGILGRGWSERRWNDLDSSQHDRRTERPVYWNSVSLVLILKGDSND
jgi:hypothetical protein